MDVERKDRKKKKKVKHFSGRGVHALAVSLSKATPDELEVILRCMNRRGRETIYETIHNCLYNFDAASDKGRELRRSLGNERKVLEHLANPKRSEAGRRRLLEQRGGQLLPILLSLAIPLIEKLLHLG